MPADSRSLSAIDKAILECQQQIELQFGLLAQQARAGIDSATSRHLLFDYQRSLIALQQAKRVLDDLGRAS